MSSIFAIVLGVVIIGSAIAADRFARSCRPLCAILLNLLGIGCLVVGLLGVFAWHHQGLQRPHALAAAIPRGQDAAVVVRMVIGPDGQLQYPVSAEASPDDVGLELEVTDTQATDTQAGGQQALVEPLAEQLDPDAQSALLHDPETDALLEQIEAQGLTEPQPEPGAELEISRVEIDYAARPQWVDQPDQTLGDRHLISVTGGPFTTRRQARQEMQKELKVRTDQYIRELVGHPHAAHWVGYEAHEIQQRFVAPDRIFDEIVRSPSFGPMHQSHALLEFGPSFHKEVERAWHDVLARAQLVKVALAGGAIFGMLVLLFGYFNADTATRGFYSGRLKFVTALAILAVVATGFVIARSIPWLWL